MDRKRLHIVLVAALLMLIAAIPFGCAENAVRFIPLVGVPEYPPTDPAEVVVFREEPHVPFEVLGQIVVDPEKFMSITVMDQKLREAAAAMGATAVVILSAANMRAGESRSELAGGQVVTALAVRFKEQ